MGPVASFDILNITHVMQSEKVVTVQWSDILFSEELTGVDPEKRDDGVPRRVDTCPGGARVQAYKEDDGCGCSDACDMHVCPRGSVAMLAAL